MHNVINTLFQYQGLLVLVLLFSLFILFTWNIWQIWYTYAIGVLYNYLIIAPIVLLLVYLNITHGKLVFGSSLSAAASLLLVLVGLFFLIYAPYTVLIDQYLILGTVLILTSILVLFIDPGKRKNNALCAFIAVVLTSLVMVPLPAGLVFDLSAYLTKYALLIAITLARIMGTSLTISSSSGIIRVIVSSPNGPVYFDIAPVCSGIIGLLSVLAVAPLLIISSLKGSRKLSRKIMGGVVGVAILAILMFFANTLRLALVFYTTSLFGKEIGYNIFHFTPEIVLVFPIVLVSLRATELLSGKINLELSIPKIRYTPGNLRILISYIVLFLVIGPVVLNYNYSTPVHVFANTDDEPIIINKLTGNIEKFIDDNISHRYNLTYLGRIHEWEQALSPTTRIHLYRRAFRKEMKFLDIYIEFSKQGSGLHLWEICLPWQNITIINTTWLYFTSVDNAYIRQVWLIEYREDELRGILVYWRDKVYTMNGIQYIRVTIMLNNFGKNITEHEAKTVINLAYELWIRSLEESFSINSIKGVGVGYFFNIAVPAAILSYTLIFQRELRLKFGIRKNLEDH